MNQHLIDSKTDYISHSTWAFSAGIKLILAGLASLVHAIHPSLFSEVAAKTVINLYYKRLHNHPNSQYQSYIEKVKQENS